MDNRERARLMDAVLDGEATPDEAKALERLLAADCAARAQFDQIKRVFDGLRSIPQAFPPEGLVASVLSNIPQNGFPRARKDQLSSRSRVIGVARKEARGTSPGISIKGSPVPPLREWSMNEHNSGSRRRNVWIGSSIAVAAALVALAYTIDFPPGAQSVVGTIVPAQRFKAAQPAMDDIKAGGAAASQSIPLQAGSAANAAANNAVVNGTTNSVVNGTTNAVDNGTTSAINAGTSNAINAGTSNAVSAGTSNAINAGTSNAINAGTSNAINAGTNNAVNAGTNNAVNAASSNAVNQSTNNAINSSVQNSVSNATSNASTK